MYVHDTLSPVKATFHFTVTLKLIQVIVVRECLQMLPHEVSQLL